MRDYRSDIDQQISKIFDKALAKNPGDRYQSATELSNALIIISDSLPGAFKAESSQDRNKQSVLSNAPSEKNKRNPAFSIFDNKWHLIATLAFLAIMSLFLFFSLSDNSNTSLNDSMTKTKMLVVLPFENLGAAEQEYFANGITAEITSRLSGLRGISVIARSSAMLYKNSEKSIEQIGEELGVEYVLEGTIQWEENTDGIRRVKVNPELIKVDGTIQIWSQRYEGDFSSAFALQSDIAGQVAGALDITLGQSERKALQIQLTENPEAYDFYLRGIDYNTRGYVEQNFSIAEQMFEKAIELDPNFAAAYAMLSDVHSNVYWHFWDGSPGRLEKSKAMMDKAMELDPNLPAAYIAAGWYYYHGLLDYENALKQFNHAIQLQPNNPEPYYGISAILRREGKVDESLKYALISLELDPRQPAKTYDIGMTYCLLRQYEKAESLFNRSIELAPDEILPYLDKARLYVIWKGNPQKAKMLLAALSDKNSDPGIRFFSILFDIYTKNFSEAQVKLEMSKNSDFYNQFFYTPYVLILAKVYGYLQNKGSERKCYEEAVSYLEDKIKSSPNDARFYSALGIAYAGLGRKADAIRTGKKATEMLPVSKESWRGSYRVWELAEIYTMVGEYELAMDQLEIVLSMPSEFSIPLIKSDPIWTQLAEKQRFNKLVEKYSL